MQIVHERRGTRRKRWRIRVIPVPPDRYPAFQNDPEHAFASMSAEKRIAEIDSACAKLWLKLAESEAVEFVTKPGALAA